MKIYTGAPQHNNYATWKIGRRPIDRSLRRYIEVKCIPPMGRRRVPIIKRELLEKLQMDLARDLTFKTQSLGFEIDHETLQESYQEIQALLDAGNNTFKVRV